MSVRIIKQYLDKITNPIDFELEPIDLDNSKYYIWGRENIRIRVLPPEFREFRKIDSQFDIFVNGQYISPTHYMFMYSGNKLIIKFIKTNFEYELDDSDQIIIRGDVEKYG